MKDFEENLRSPRRHNAGNPSRDREDEARTTREHRKTKTLLTNKEQRCAQTTSIYNLRMDDTARRKAEEIRRASACCDLSRTSRFPRIQCLSEWRSVSRAAF